MKGKKGQTDEVNMHSFCPQNMVIGLPVAFSFVFLPRLSNFFCPFNPFLTFQSNTTKYGPVRCKYYSYCAFSLISFSEGISKDYFFL